MFKDLLSQPKCFFSVRKRWFQKALYKIFIAVFYISFLICGAFYAKSSNCLYKNKIIAFTHISFHKGKLEKTQKFLEKISTTKSIHDVHTVLSIPRNMIFAKSYSKIGNSGKPNILNAEEDNKRAFTTVFLVGSIVLFSVIGFIMYRQKKLPLLFAMIFNFKKEASQIENTSSPPEKRDENDPVTKSTYGISEEMTNFILKKLGKFEVSGKFLRKDINLTWLSNHFNTNSKYISEVIKVHRNKNFNSYINGLRIQYITNKLIEDPVYREYKISYLSEECGYASTQVFVIAFKKETGVTPSHFIDQLKNQL